MRSDPVCNTVVDENTANKTSYREKDYYFCSEACQGQFQTNPESFRVRETSKGGQFQGERMGNPGTAVTEARPFSQEADKKTEQVKSMARNVKEKAMKQSKSFLQNNKDYAAGRLEGTANAFRQTAGNFEGEIPTVSRYVNQIADKIEGASQYLREKEVKELIEDTERFVKSKPVLSIAAAVATGVIVARFLKSSRPEV